MSWWIAVHLFNTKLTGQLGQVRVEPQNILKRSYSRINHREVILVLGRRSLHYLALLCPLAP